MSEPASGENEEKSKPFACTSPGCDQRFPTSETLKIHKQKHQMTLKLGPSRAANLQDVLPIDQTPTPTRFLQMGNQVGLFDELKENPFDREFKTAQKEGGITPKQRRAASVVQQLQLRTNNHKAKTPTTPTWPLGISSSAEADGHSGTSQPVHVIALTPTLPSPGLLPGAPGQYFLPPLIPSPQGPIPALPGYTATSPMQVPATLLSPTLMPFPTGLIPNAMMADAQQRAFAQAMFAAAASAASPLATTVQSQHAAPSESVTKEVSATRTMPSNSTAPQQNVPTLILPKQERPMSVASVGSDGSGPMSQGTSVIQRVSAGSTEHTYEPQSHQMPYPMMNDVNEKKISAASMATNNHIAMPANTTLPSVSSLSMLSQQPVLPNHVQQPLSRTSSSNDFGSNSNLAEAKQKLKETITSNNPSLQQAIAAEKKISSSSDSSAPFPTTSSSQSEEAKPVPRRRGRQQQDIDPDVKRQRFLERNRAAASRCRNKKKKWVNGLETKAKGLTQLNIQLQNEIASLKDEIASLKQLLLSHRDCPITKMQQQSMAMAGINLNTLEPSTPSTVILDSVVKSESPGSSAGEGGHPSLSATLSSGSMDESLRSSNPNLAMQQPVTQAQPGAMSNGQMMYPNIIASSAGTT